MRSSTAPARRVRRRPWTSAEFASLDFETTGLDLVNDHVVSFGVVPIRAGRIVLGEGTHQLVDPPIPPSPSSVTIHGMRTQDLLGSPTIADATEALAGALANRYLLAWYSTLELAILGRMFGRQGRGFSRRCIDVRKIALVVGGGEVSASFANSLTRCATHYGVPVAAPHEAFDDALVTAQLFLVLTSRLRRDGGIPTVRDLLRAGR